MKVHEYQAKELFRQYDIPVPHSVLVDDTADAENEIRKMGAPCVVKAQVHAGGRGKAGGVKVASSVDKAIGYAKEILGMTLISPQTGPEGTLVRKILIEEGINIKDTFYLAFILDREKHQPVLMASTEGGVEIEEVAATKPDMIFKTWISPVTGIMPWQCRDIGGRLGLKGDLLKKFYPFLTNLYRMFMEKDCSLLEINPVVITGDGEILAVDAKVNFDDNSLVRHKDIAELRDKDEEEPLEVLASEQDLNYIKLDGSVGCMVNGAGLAMATMDILKLYGGDPANFLDVGGGTSKERVREAFKILLADTNVKAVFVNIFGGIVRTDLVANGIIGAAGEIDINVPVVIRLRGTNEVEGRRLIKESGLGFYAIEDFSKAAEKAVELAGER